MARASGGARVRRRKSKRQPGNGRQISGGSTSVLRKVPINILSMQEADECNGVTFQNQADSVVAKPDAVVIVAAFEFLGVLNL